MSSDAAAISAEADEELAHLYRLAFGDLGFCGCGDPGAAYNLVRDLLGQAPFYDHRAEVSALIGAGPDHDGTYWLILYVLDGAGLTDHGGSAGGAWLTPKGALYLGLMRKHEWDAVDMHGYPHDGGACPPGCRFRQPDSGRHGG